MCVCVSILPLAELILIWNLGCCSLFNTRIHAIYFSTNSCWMVVNNRSAVLFCDNVFYLSLSFNALNVCWRCCCWLVCVPIPTINILYLSSGSRVCARLVYGEPNKFKKMRISFWFPLICLFTAFRSFFSAFSFFSSVCALEYALLLVQADKHCLPAWCLSILLLLSHTNSLIVVLLNWIYRFYSRFHHIYWWNFWQRTEMQTQKTNHPRLISLVLWRCLLLHP